MDDISVNSPQLDRPYRRFDHDSMTFGPCFNQGCCTEPSTSYDRITERMTG
ncbi:hypothetical protein HMPREF9593_02002 [Cutibacterium acnes HL046PA2]|nr:hypothetical protein HMPREF9593_02002 [Cutibacterium acnes HL046PA2]EFT55040.1 hypothetical protein HMPREF9610_01968 [Cutibacterium acnes HL027PA2]EGF71606.1 hypothetical protein HMPREF9563_00625 [Cutibacterium acnes HL020PA1]